MGAGEHPMYGNIRTIDNERKVSNHRPLGMGLALHVFD